MRQWALGVMAAFWLGSVAFGQPAQPLGKLTIRETRLGALPPTTQPYRLTTRPAYAPTSRPSPYASATSRPVYSMPASRWDIPSGWISPDWKKLAYIYSDMNGKKRMVINGATGRAYDAIYEDRIVWSPDSSRIGYVAREGASDVLVIDAREVAKYPTIWTPVFSADGKRTGFLADDLDKTRLVVIDGAVTRCAPGEGAGQITFSTDGKHAAYAAFAWHQPENWHLVLDGRAYGRFARINELQFSPDSRQVIFEDPNDHGFTQVVENGQLTRRQGGLPTFSPDGRRSLYVIGIEPRDMRRSPTWEVIPVVDGVRGQTYARIRELKFSADSKHVIMAASRAGGPTSRPNAVSVDGQQLVNGVGLDDPFVLSPDGRSVGYNIDDGRGARLIGVNNRILASVGRYISAPEFSLDSKWIRFLEKKGNAYDWTVTGVNGERWPAGQPAGRLFPRKLYARALWRNGQAVLWVQGHESEPYDAIFCDRTPLPRKPYALDPAPPLPRPEATCRIEADNLVRAFAIRNGHLLALEATFDWGN